MNFKYLTDVIINLLINLTAFLYQNIKSRYQTGITPHTKSRKVRCLCGLPALCLLFKLAEFGLILVVSIWLSILSCIDISYLFHTLFFVSHIFSTNPVPLHFFIIVCSSGGLQVGWTIQIIIVRWFASSPMGIII